MKITIIAAADQEDGIGREGELPWDCPEDLAFFKRRSLGKPVIMGSDTIQSLPEGGLPGRSIIPLGKRVNGATSFEEALENARNEASRFGAPEILIGGGVSVYRASLPHANTALITRIPGKFACDRFLPELSPSEWRKTAAEKIGLFNGKDVFVEVFQRSGKSV